ncbi:metal-dependent hydrolase [Photobacterium damselae subsp. damselae]|uniref:metal-dependent hydrolase n=1 Tax=Photobacterium damselae TaxID=38293 RepID=UPI001F42B342|nr:metal-dependent hydrolase [Photobacterium damselae]UKA24403.1 metal-dependent hydrolase [Photobacterium damselae subsp. damselae]
MANFTTHFTVAAVVSGVAAAALLSAEHVMPVTAIWLAFLGTMGGLLPDIDSDHSTSMKWLFTLLASFSCFILLCHIYSHVTMLELLFYIVGLFIIVQVIIKAWVQRITIHRGCCHSIAFVTLLALCVTHLASLLGYKNTFSWLSGGFVLLGGLVHLILDEIYSVDLANKRIKSSFGSALKPFSLSNPFISLAQVTAIVLLLYSAPPAHSTILLLSHWQHFHFSPSWLNVDQAQYWLKNVLNSTADKIKTVHIPSI